MKPNVYLVADIQFSVGLTKVIHSQIYASTYGITGLPWEPLSSEHHFGKITKAALTFYVPQAITFHVNIRLQREALRIGMSVKIGMAVYFMLTATQLEEIADLVKKYGFPPQHYTRKFPRIPVLPQIKNFPTDALIPDKNIVCHVCNISPGGILLLTQNRLCEEIQPDDNFPILIFPPGWNPPQIALHTSVCRKSEDLIPANGHREYGLGLQITRMSETNRSEYLRLLKEILNRLDTTILADSK